MTDRKPCIRCERQIDEHARSCPFCNWDQSQPIPPPEEASAAPAYVPPPKKRWEGKALGAIAFAALLIIAFVVGTLIHGFEPSEVKAAQAKNGTTTAPTKPSPRSNVTLVPVTGSDALAEIEQPITTAPAQAAGEQPNDATALPADQYATAAARAKAMREAEAKSRNSIVDPRALTGSAYEQSQRTAGVPKASSTHTSAYLEYRPLPRFAVDHDITARLNLTIDPEGHVTDIDVNEPVPNMPKVIASVQSWRFKPATDNGVAVTSHVSVNITFRAHE